MGNKTTMEYASCCRILMKRLEEVGIVTKIEQMQKATLLHMARILERVLEF